MSRFIKLTRFSPVEQFDKNPIWVSSPAILAFFAHQRHRTLGRDSVLVTVLMLSSGEDGSEEVYETPEEIIALCEKDSSHG